MAPALHHHQTSNGLKMVMIMIVIMMMRKVVEVLGTKVPLFSKVNNRNSGSWTFSALLMLMITTPRIFWIRIMATTMITDDDANDDAIDNQTSRSWAAFALFCERQSLSVPCKILAVLDLEHFYTLPQRMIIIYTVHLS